MTSSPSKYAKSKWRRNKTNFRMHSTWTNGSSRLKKPIVTGLPKKITVKNKSWLTSSIWWIKWSSQASVVRLLEEMQALHQHLICWILRTRKNTLLVAWWTQRKPAWTEPYSKKSLGPNVVKNHQNYFRLRLTIRFEVLKNDAWLNYNDLMKYFEFGTDELSYDTVSVYEVRSKQR